MKTMKMYLALTISAALLMAGVSAAALEEQTKNDTSTNLSPVKHGNLRELSGANRRLANCGHGNPGNGECSDSSLCCSQYGWCGKEAAHCSGKPTPAKAATQSNPASSTCANGFDPRGKNRVIKNQYATYHEEYTPGYKGGQITTNCDDMAKVTLGESNDMVAAMHTGEYGGGARCGSCVLVQGPYSSVVVTVIDKCECDGPGSNLDMSPAAFRAINNGKLSAGIIPITWKTVSCSINESKQVHYRFKQGSSKYWMQLAVVYNVDPIKKVEVKVGNQYYEMAMQNHGYWAFVGSTPSLETPMPIRLTSTSGQVVKDVLSSIKSSQRVLVKGTGVQFKPKCSA